MLIKAMRNMLEKMKIPNVEELDLNTGALQMRIIMT